MSRRFRWSLGFALAFAADLLAVPISASQLTTARTSVSRLELHETAPVVKVEQHARKETAELVAETAHFRVVYQKDAVLMERVARVAEAARWRAHRSWFGDSQSEWGGKTTIYLFASRQQYSKKTGMKASLAHAQSHMTGNLVSSRSISLPSDAPGLFDDVLPHEVTHSVMAHRFNGRLPRWADEGMAVLAESAGTQQRRRQDLAEARAKDELFDIEILLTTDDPQQTGTWEYYCQSTSLVEFFVAMQGRQTFLRFLTDSIRTNYRSALKTHYAIASFAELHDRWFAFAFAEPLTEPHRGPERLALRTTQVRPLR